jgi:uncharacterized membrane protein HdeD (DUF308 family)
MARTAVGLYFLVTGALYLPAALYALGIESPPAHKWVMWAVPLIQAAVAFAAGWYLVKARPVQAEVEESSRTRNVLSLFVQLLGLYFVVDGVAAAARPLADMLAFSEAWQLRAGSLASAAVQLVAGAWFLVRTRRVVALIESRGEDAT